MIQTSHSLKWWKLKTKKVLHKYIQLRDVVVKNGSVYAQCLACKKVWELTTSYDWKNFHASHRFRADLFQSVEFNEDNIHGCCYNCNRRLSGNLGDYDINLRKKIGDERYNELIRKKNQPHKLTIVELEKIFNEYKTKVKEIKKLKGIK